MDGTSSLSGEERQLDWERAASYVARACVSHAQGADHVGDPFEHPIAALTIRSRRESPTAQLYSRLVTSFEGKLAGLKDDGYPMALAIPPVPAVVLDRSDGSLRSVIQETVALRAEFAPFREKYQGYVQTLRDPQARTLKELLDERWTAISEVSAAIDALGGQRTDSTLIQGLIGGNIKVGDGNGGDSVSLDPAVSIGGLAKVVIQKVKGTVVKARASILFDVWSKALEISRYNTLSERRLGTAFPDRAILAYRSYANAVEGLIKPLR